MKPPGEMKTHETGAKREDKTGKGRPDLISPIMLTRLAILMEEGAVAHGERNWEQGMKLSSLLAPAFRHFIQTIDGCEDEDHPIQAIFNLMAYVHTLHLIRTGALPPELDDLPHAQNLLRKNLTSPDEPAIKQHETRKLANPLPTCCDKCGRSFSKYESHPPSRYCTCFDCGEMLTKSNFRHSADPNRCDKCEEIFNA